MGNDIRAFCTYEGEADTFGELKMSFTLSQPGLSLAHRYSMFERQSCGPHLKIGPSYTQLPGNIDNWTCSMEGLQAQEACVLKLWCEENRFFMACTVTRVTSIACCFPYFFFCEWDRNDVYRSPLYGSGLLLHITVFITVCTGQCV